MPLTKFSIPRGGHLYTRRGWIPFNLFHLPNIESYFFVSENRVSQAVFRQICLLFFSNLQICNLSHDSLHFHLNLINYKILNINKNRKRMSSKYRVISLGIQTFELISQSTYRIYNLKRYLRDNLKPGYVPTAGFSKLYIQISADLNYSRPQIPYLLKMRLEQYIKSISKVPSRFMILFQINYYFSSTLIILVRECWLL